MSAFQRLKFSVRSILIGGVLFGAIVAGALRLGDEFGAVDRYYMPGPLGRQRVRKEKLTAESWKADRAGESESEGERAQSAGSGSASTALLRSTSDRPPVKSESVGPFEQENKPRKDRDPGTAATEHRPPGEYERQITEDEGRMADDRRRRAAEALSALHASRSFLTRFIGLRGGDEAEWGRRNRLTEYLPFTHNLLSIVPRELYATHPEFFPVVDGRRYRPTGPYDWQPDIGREDFARYAATQAARHFDTHPTDVSFSLGINDGIIYGDSPEARALVLPPRWFRGRPDYSRLVFTFMNRAAADLAKTHPDKYLGCLAYYWCENTPPFPVAPNIIPFLTADRSQDYDPGFHAEEFALQERWAGAAAAAAADDGGRTAEVGGQRTDDGQQRTEDRGRRTEVGGRSLNSQPSTFNSQLAERGLRPRLGLYDYLDGQGFLVPRVPIHAFAEHIRHAHEVGFTDYFGESLLNWGLIGPLPWTIAQLLQDPEQDVDALLDEYYANYFGPAAAPMRRFFERCEEQWMRQPGPPYWLKHFRNESQAILFPPPVCQELRALLDEAAAAANGGRARLPGVPVQGSDSHAEAAKGAEEERHPIRPGDLGARSPSSPDRDPAVRTDERISAGALIQGKKDDGLVAQRVRFVSDSFGVTERFVLFQEAREALTSVVLRGEVLGAAGEQLFRTYRERRREFIEYTQATTAKWPLAFYPINYDDWLRNDPTFAATFQLAAAAAAAGGRGRGTDDGGRRVVDEKRTTEDGGLRVTEDSLGADDPSSAIRHLPSVIRSLSAFPSSEVLPNGTLAGPLWPARRMGDLLFGVDLPAPWHSDREPTEKNQNVETLKQTTEDGGRMPEEGEKLKAESGKAETVGERESEGEGAQSSGVSSVLLGSTSDRPPVKTKSVRSFEQEDKPRKGREPSTQTAEVGGRSFNSQPSTLSSGRDSAPSVFQPPPFPIRYLHFSGETTVTVFQWIPAKAGTTYLASASVRGRVSPSNIVTLSIGWLDAKQKRIGNATVMRLPIGEWPEWVRMMQGGQAPAGAAWLGIGFRTEYQLPGDWVDVGSFSVKETLTGEISRR